MKIIDHSYYMKKVKGDVGVEVEAELNKIFDFDLVDSLSEKGWGCVEDNSLKGPSAEFVMEDPCKLKDLGQKLGLIRMALSHEGLTINSSIRAGVHVHLNVQNNTFEEVVKTALVYQCLETVMMHFCGSNREGNLFCLRSRDAEGMLYIWDLILREPKELWPSFAKKLFKDNVRYASLNFKPLFNYGSIEFRGMRTDPDLEGIEDFARMVTYIKKYASKKEDLRDIAKEISHLGGEGWLSTIFPKKYAKLLKYKGMDKDIYDDFRRVQLLINTASEKMNA